MASTITLSVALSQAGPNDQVPPLTAYAFDADGALVGQAPIPGGAATAPVVSGGTLYVTGRDGQLHAYR